MQTKRVDAWEISLLPQNWGDVRIEDIEKVLHSVADALLPYFPNRPPEQLLVKHADDAPRAVYRGTSMGAITIHLTAVNRSWSQFAYQFAHELCHVLCNYERTVGASTANVWFEETLCETASYFALRRMASAWSVSPPYPNWRDYAPSFKKYVDESIVNYRVPPTIRLSSWFMQNETVLRSNAGIREKNAVVAVHLLPLLEANPANWNAVRYLYGEKPCPPVRFERHLQDWYARCPRPYNAFVQQVAQLFEINAKKPRI